ncbi:MAG: DUF1848 domain-containing protein [Armatimonadetes bacterium]|nr:DUF1848 domain-containing protein [Armatimonadota bacterium]NOG38128.1 DUF1848 domain-containing protein [Armatimonadota bacterium]GIK31917.1 MAG: hypothetical protein BroJett009_09090 [Armatimonadota bacterium]
MVISASYKTDIPAFYGRWLLKRLDAGYCWVKNPFSERPFFVSLACEDVDGIVFWTKNAWPFMSAAEEVRRKSFPFYFQYTVTGYGEVIERAVLRPSRSVDAIRRIVDQFGSGSVIWRYDPIVLTDSMSFDWHVENFSNLAAALAGYVDEVATKFMVVHSKTRRNLTAAIGRSWFDPDPASKAELLRAIDGVSKSQEMRMTLCSEPETQIDLPKAVCIDAARLNRMGAHIEAPRTLGNRHGCLCIEARDIGDYDTCPQGCAYCYATQQQRLTILRHSQHDPLAESLIPMRCPSQPPNVRQPTLLDCDPRSRIVSSPATGDC